MTPPAPASEPLSVVLVLARGRAWRWPTWLAQKLTDQGYTVSYQFEPQGGLPGSLQLLIDLERVIFATPPNQACAVLDAAQIQALPAGAEDARYDLAIDFTGTAKNVNADRILRPCFDGIAGDMGPIAALLDRRGPRLGVLDSATGLTEDGMCALEQPAIFTRGLDGVFSRMVALLLKAVRQLAAQDGGLQANAQAKPAPASPSLAQPLTFLARSVAIKASARLDRLMRTAPRWSIAWRRGEADHQTLDIAWQDFTRLPDGGSRYYADPFVLMRGDTAHVFCEEVPFATGKGIISHFTIGPDGKPTTPRPVLEQPYHLSYPFMFERDGEIWMIPETSANRTVELYRAERFPDRWVKEAVLLDDVLADDATLVEHEGRLWMFAGLRDWQASSWEALGLFYSDTLLGPWHAHAGNPVLLDPTAARPGGALFKHKGELIRPVQDCRGGYGAGLAFARVDRLDEEGFAQEVIARTIPRTAQTKGLHTYNRAGDFEVIDLLGKI